MQSTTGSPDISEITPRLDLFGCPTQNEVEYFGIYLLILVRLEHVNVFHLTGESHY